MKKLVSLTLVLAMMFSLGASALAADISTGPMEPVETVVNEYDIYVREKENTEGEYSVMGIGDTEEKTIEELYLERAALSEEELVAQYNYSEEQIAILKAYDGSPIEENPQLRAVSASMSGRVTTSTAYSYLVAATLSWSWNQKPFTTSVNQQDSIKAVWEVSDENGSVNNNHAMNVSQSRNIVEYCAFSSNTIVATRLYNITETSIVSSAGLEPFTAFSTFPQALDLPQYTDGPFWAKSGTCKIAVEPTSNYDIGSVIFGFVYLGNTFNIDVGLGITLKLDELLRGNLLGAIELTPGVSAEWEPNIKIGKTHRVDV